MTTNSASLVLERGPRFTLLQKSILIASIYLCFCFAVFHLTWELRRHQIQAQLVEIQDDAAYTPMLEWDYSPPLGRELVLKDMLDLSIAIFPEEAAIEKEEPPANERPSNETPDTSANNTTDNLATETNASLRETPIACEDLTLVELQLLIPSFSQRATYESVARSIEACTGRDRETGYPGKLCTGTRLEASSTICGKTKKFTTTMYRWDESGMGALAQFLNISVAIAFGSIQIICMIIAVLGIHQAKTIGKKLTQNEEEEDKRRFSSDIASFEQIKQRGFRALRETDTKNPDIFLMMSEEFRRFVELRMRQIQGKAETIILFGLLGTLMGMLLLFGALSRSESAEALTSQLATSQMLGSLGLAFGTTIFAALVRLIYGRTIDPIAANCLKYIDEATTRTIQELSSEGYERATLIVGSEDADTISLAQRGNMIRARYATVGQQDDDAKEPVKSKVFAYRFFAFGFTLVVGTLAALYFNGALMVAVE